MTQLKQLRKRLANINYRIAANQDKLKPFNKLFARQMQLALQRSECLKAIARLTIAKP